MATKRKNMKTEAPDTNEAPSVPTTNEAPSVPTTNEAPSVPTTNEAPSAPVVNIGRRPLASPIGGAPVTLARLLRAMIANVTDGASILARRGKRGGWELLRACGVASLSRLQPGSAPSGWIVAMLLRAADANAERALARAAEWADATLEAARAGKLASDKPAAWIVADVERLLAARAGGGDHNRGTVGRGIGAAYSDRTRRVAAVAYVCSAPALLPEWVLNEPIPDALREPGLERTLAQLEAAL